MTTWVGRNRIAASIAAWFFALSSIVFVAAAEEPDGRDAEVLDRRDGLRIFEGSVCGGAESGREAVLENLRDDGTVRVVVEASAWRGETFEESRRQRHSLAGRERARLGCTRRGPIELRYSIVRILDDAVPPDPVRDRWASSRAFIALTDTGPCGEDSAGRSVTISNRHQDREILVFIEVVRRVGGRFRGRSMASYKLGPGAERELGCDRDGRVEREFYLLETD